MEINREAIINFILEQFGDEEEFDAERERTKASLESLSDFDLYLAGEAYRHEYERDAYFDWLEGAIEDATEGNC